MNQSSNRKFLLKYGICQLLLVHLCSSGTHVGESCSDGSGGVGTCKMFLDCPSASLALREGGDTLKHCGFRGRDPIVCCPDVQLTTPVQEPSSTLSFSKPGEKAQYWCDEYRNICPVSLLGGSLAEIKEFPHMAAIGYGSKERITWGCGGSLISDKFVMTAAHCLRSGTGPPKWVLLGTEVARSFTDSTSPYGRRGQTHSIVRIIRHPEYKPPSKYHDLALLEISPNTLEVNPLELNTRELHPACLPTGWTSNPIKIIATGWGRVGYGEETSPDLLKVDLDILDSALCNKTYDVEIKTTKQLTRGIDDSMLCAGVLEGGKDTCQGDSGGPLQVPVKETCLYEVWGITSFGKICGLANSPAVYMKVAAYVPWIESIVWP